MNPTIVKYAERVGIRDAETLKKSEEMLRLINLKSNISINEPAKIMLSIDFAAALCNTEFSSEDAVKFSGLKNKEYMRQKELLEKLLDMGKKLTMDEICAQLEISDAIKKDAIRLLKEYKKKNQYIEDINSPQYVTMALYQSCKLKKFKSSHKAKLTQISRLNSKMWKRLDEEWTEWLKTATFLSPSNANPKASNELAIDDKENTANDGRSDKVVKMEVEIQPYEEWRDNIIARAKQAIQNKT